MDEQRGRTWSPADKAEYRRFVRANHPDFGGDPEVFAAGVRRFHQTSPTHGDIVVVRQRRGLPRLVAVLAARRRRRRRTRVR